MQCSVSTLVPGSVLQLCFAHPDLPLDLLGCRAFLESAIVMVLASALRADIRDVRSAAKAASCSCIQVYNPVCETATQVSTALESFGYQGLQMGQAATACSSSAPCTRCLFCTMEQAIGCQAEIEAHCQGPESALPQRSPRQLSCLVEGNLSEAEWGG